MYVFFFFNDTATTEIYPLSLHDALPIFHPIPVAGPKQRHLAGAHPVGDPATRPLRSEEHTSELQSRQYLVCRLLLEKKKKSRARALRTIQPGHCSPACTPHANSHAHPSF